MQPGSYCRIIDARCAQLKIFLKKKSKKEEEEECISISSISSSQALFPSFVRVEWRCFVGVLWCVSIALSKRQRRRRKKKNGWTASVFQPCATCQFGSDFFAPFILTLLPFSRFYSTVLTELFSIKMCSFNSSSNL
jgi:hypothetical protein